MRRVGLLEAWTPEEVWALIGRLGARTLVFDVEPLVAVWATDTAALDAGVAATLGRIAGLGRVAGSERVAGSGDDGPHESAGGAGAAGGGGPHEGAGGAGAGGELAGGGSADSTSTGAGFAGAGIASSGIAGSGFMGSGFMGSGFTAAGSAGGRPGPDVVAFATNSARLPTVLPGLAGARVGYRASAAKPLRVQGFRDLPRPGLVIGDQIATDGALAWRLGFDFVYYQPARGRIPLRPRLLHLVGAGLRPLLFEVPPFR